MPHNATTDPNATTAGKHQEKTSNRSSRPHRSIPQPKNIAASSSQGTLFNENEAGRLFLTTKPSNNKQQHTNKEGGKGKGGRQTPLQCSSPGAVQCTHNSCRRTPARIVNPGTVQRTKYNSGTANTTQESSTEQTYQARRFRVARRLLLSKAAPAFNNSVTKGRGPSRRPRITTNVMSQHGATHVHYAHQPGLNTARRLPQHPTRSLPNSPLPQLAACSPSRYGITHVHYAHRPRLEGTPGPRPSGCPFPFKVIAARRT